MSSTHIETGPVYGVPLIHTLPIGGGMMQAMPTRYDLEQARKQNERVVAGYEVLLSHYREQLNEIQRLNSLNRDGIPSRDFGTGADW